MEEFFGLFGGLSVNEQEQQTIQAESSPVQHQQGQQEDADGGVNTPDHDEPVLEHEKDPRLFHAVGLRNWEEANQLLDQGVGIKYTKLNGCTVLHLAVKKNAPSAIIEKIVEKGIDVNVPDQVTFNTPLHYALRDGSSPEVVSTLVKLGADVNKLGIGSVTPIALGVNCNRSVDVLKIVVENGANLNVMDEMQWTPLHWAMRSNVDPQVVRLLLEHGADPNARHPADVRTLVDYAINDGARIESFRLLLFFGAHFRDDEMNAVARPQGIYHSVMKKARIMTLLCTPGCVTGSESILRIVPTDVLRDLSVFLFGHLRPSEAQ